MRSITKPSRMAVGVLAACVLATREVQIKPEEINTPQGRAMLGDGASE